MAVGSPSLILHESLLLNPRRFLQAGLQDRCAYLLLSVSRNDGDLRCASAAPLHVGFQVCSGRTQHNFEH